ncbi:MAG: glycosyltransferase [Candidatus Omnitrophota bacterium]
MNEQPLVSIIVRTYNRPERLQECLQCLQKQDYRRIEIVVVNDGGADVEHLLPVELGGLDYRYIRNPENMGRTAALNIGVEAAKGDYIAFLDDDDGALPHHIRTLVEAAAPQGLPVVYSDVLNVTFERDPRTQAWRRVKEQLIYSFDFERNNFLLANYIPINCLLIRRDCFDAAGPFDESLSIYEDWEFLIRLSQMFPFKHVRAVTGEYRRRDDNSNILEQESYPINERVVKRRYRDQRDGVFDEIFKRTFQQQREIRQREAQFEQLLRQANHLQIQLAEAQKIILQLQRENSLLRREKPS